MANKTEIYESDRTGLKYTVNYVSECPTYGQGCYSTKYLYKGKIGFGDFYFWYTKDDLDLNGDPDQQKEYDENFKIEWSIIPGDIADQIKKDI